MLMEGLDLGALPRGRWIALSYYLRDDAAPECYLDGEPIQLRPSAAAMSGEPIMGEGPGPAPSPKQSQAEDSKA